MVLYQKQSTDTHWYVKLFGLLDDRVREEIISKIKDNIFLRHNKIPRNLEDI